MSLHGASSVAQDGSNEKQQSPILSHPEADHEAEPIVLTATEQELAATELARAEMEVQLQAMKEVAQIWEITAKKAQVAIDTLASIERAQEVEEEITRNVAAVTDLRGRSRSRSRIAGVDDVVMRNANNDCADAISLDLHLHTTNHE